MTTITGSHQLKDTSVAAKSGKLLLSGQACGTGTCDNIGINFNAQTIAVGLRQNGLQLSTSLGYLI